MYLYLYVHAYSAQGDYIKGLRYGAKSAKRALKTSTLVWAFWGASLDTYLGFFWMQV